MDIVTKCIYMSLNVVFHETSFAFLKLSQPNHASTSSVLGSSSSSVHFVTLSTSKTIFNIFHSSHVPHNPFSYDDFHLSSPGLSTPMNSKDSSFSSCSLQPILEISSSLLDPSSYSHVSTSSSSLFFQMLTIFLFQLH